MMRSQRGLLWFLLLLSIGINLGLFASRWTGRGEERPKVATRQPVPRPGVPGALLRLSRELGLQGQEKEAFLALQQDFLNRLLAGREEIQTLQGNLRQQLMAKRPDREEIDRTLEALAPAYVRLESAFVDDLLSSRALLSPEQEKIYLGFMQKVRQARIEEMQRHLRGAGAQHWREKKGRPRG